MTSQSELQKQVDEYVRKTGLVDTESRILELVARVGELANTQLKGMDYGRRKFVDGGIFGFGERLTNVLLSLIALANIEQYDLGMFLEARLKELQEPKSVPKSPNQS